MKLWSFVACLLVLAASEDSTDVASEDNVTSNSTDTGLHLHTAPGCQISVEKEKVVSKGISSVLKATVQMNSMKADISVNITQGNETTEMILKQGFAREFRTVITTTHLGRSYYNICVSGCYSCKEVSVYSIPAPLTLLPPILTVFLAVVTRQVLLSLTCGVFTSALLASAYNPLDAFMQTFNSYLVLPFLDPGKAGVVVFSCLMAGVIEIMEKSGGAKGFANQIFKLASSVYHAGILTFGIAFAFFFDDFASIMISGKSLGPLVSELGLSTQKFSLIVHMMGVIIASLCPLSSWAGIQIGYIESAFKLVGMEVSGFSYLMQCIPYRFFVVSSLLAVMLYVLINKDIPPMIGYEEEKRTKGRRITDLSDIKEDPEEQKETVEDIPERWYNAIIPLVTLVAVSILRMYFDGKEAIISSGLDIPVTFVNCVSKCDSINSLIIGTSVSLVLTLVLIPAQRIMGLSKCLEHFVEGVKSMSEPIMILILAWALGVAMNDIHTSEYIALALGDNMPVEYFPALVCLIGYAMSYASGSAMGTQGIIFPLVVPVIVHLTKDEDVYIKTIAAAFSSTVFGNLCSPIADTTIAGVLFTGCPMLDHIKVMSVFCVPLAVISLIFGDLLVGLEIYPFYVAYIINIVIVFVVFVVFGRGVKGKSLIQTLVGRHRTRSDSSCASSEDGERTSLLSKTEKGD